MTDALNDEQEKDKEQGQERRMMTIPDTDGYVPIALIKWPRFQHLQALEDAIEYRIDRMTVPCANCGTDDTEQCDEHACDSLLIACYKRTAIQITRELSAAAVGVAV